MDYTVVPLTAYEAYRIERKAGKLFEAFIRGEGIYGKTLYLRHERNGDCVFLQRGERYSCKVYEERPRACREFPGPSQACP